jgi:hypothetical protein
MRFFPLLDIQYVTLAFFMGLGGLIAIWLAFRGHRREGEGQVEEGEYPDGIRIGRGPLPPLLVLVYAGFLLWALAYAIKVGIMGPSF